MNSIVARRWPIAVFAVMILAAAAIWMTAAGPAGASAGFSPRLSSTKTPVEKVVPTDSAPYTVAATPKRVTKIAKPKSKTSSRATSSSRTAKSTGSKTSKSSSGKSKSTSKKSSKASSGNDLARAQSVLRSYIGKYPILGGASVSIGDARGNQAICYYGSGRIVISPSHSASIDRIMAHEIWHIIDWRDNGKIDWGESIPPKNASSFGG